MVLILIVLAIVLIYILWNTDYIDKITDYLSATPEERKKRREYEKDVKELMKTMEENDKRYKASIKHNESSETHYRRGCGTFDFEANKPFAIKSAEKVVSAYGKFVRNNKFTYVTKNKYCKYDGLILIAFLERNHLVAEVEENVDEFTANYFDGVISLVASWYSMGIKEAREMFFNRVSLYNEIFCRPNETYGKKMESCAWELTQLIKYDISYGSYQEYTSSSPLIVMDIFEETRIQAEVFDLIKGVAEKL